MGSTLFYPRWLPSLAPTIAPGILRSGRFASRASALEDGAERLFAQRQVLIQDRLHGVGQVARIPVPVSPASLGDLLGPAHDMPGYDALLLGRIGAVMGGSHRAVHHAQLQLRELVEKRREERL